MSDEQNVAVEEATAEETAVEEAPAVETTAKESVAEVVEEVAAKAEEVVESAGEAVKEAAASAKETAAEVVEEVVAAVEEVTEPAEAEAEAEAAPAEETAEAGAAEEASDESAEETADAAPAEEATEESAEAAPAEEAASSEESEDFASALAEHEAAAGAAASESGPKPGDRVKGKIVSIGEASAFVDLGTKAEGIVEIAELKDAEGNVTANVGDEIDAVVRGRDEGGGVLLSIKLGQGQKALEELKIAFEQGVAVDGIVTAANKGGVEVKVAGLRGFCPMSQLDLRYVEDPSQFIEQTLSFRITQFEETPAKGRRPNIVLSRRALLEEEAKEMAAETRAKLEVGAVLEGTVSSLADYGAFIDLGGLDGLLHVSEIDHTRVSHPKDVLQVGQRVEVKITKIEASKDPKRSERISLSRRALAPDPWNQAASNLTEGDTVPGTVVRLESFGAFVNLAPGVDGLVHISELGAGRRVEHPKEVVQPGQQVEVRVLRVDIPARRVSLSMAPEGQSRGGGGGGGGRGRGGRRDGGGRGGRDDYRERRPRPTGPPQVVSSTGGGTFGAMADFFKKAQESSEGSDDS